MYNFDYYKGLNYFGFHQSNVWICKLSFIQDSSEYYAVTFEVKPCAFVYLCGLGIGLASLIICTLCKKLRHETRSQLFRKIYSWKSSSRNFVDSVETNTKTKLVNFAINCNNNTTSKHSQIITISEENCCKANTICEVKHFQHSSPCNNGDNDVHPIQKQEKITSFTPLDTHIFPFRKTFLTRSLSHSVFKSLDQTNSSCKHIIKSQSLTSEGQAELSLLRYQLMFTKKQTIGVIIDVDHQNFAFRITYSHFFTADEIKASNHNFSTTLLRSSAPQLAVRRICDFAHCYDNSVVDSNNSITNSFNYNSNISLQNESVFLDCHEDVKAETQSSSVDQINLNTIYQVFDKPGYFISSIFDYISSNEILDQSSHTHKQNPQKMAEYIIQLFRQKLSLSYIVEKYGDLMTPYDTFFKPISDYANLKTDLPSATVPFAEFPSTETTLVHSQSQHFGSNVPRCSENVLKLYYPRLCKSITADLETNMQNSENNSTSVRAPFYQTSNSRRCYTVSTEKDVLNPDSSMNYIYSDINLKIRNLELDLAALQTELDEIELYRLKIDVLNDWHSHQIQYFTQKLCDERKAFEELRLEEEQCYWNTCCKMNFIRNNIPNDVFEDFNKDCKNDNEDVPDTIIVTELNEHALYELYKKYMFLL